MNKSLIAFAIVCLLSAHISPIVSKLTHKNNKTVEYSNLKQSQCGMGTYSYQVKSGDSCYSIGTYFSNKLATNRIAI